MCLVYCSKHWNDWMQSVITLSICCIILLQLHQLGPNIRITIKYTININILFQSRVPETAVIDNSQRKHCQISALWIKGPQCLLNSCFEFYYLQLPTQL